MSVFIGKSNLKFGAVTFTKDSHQISKKQISVVDSLIDHEFHYQFLWRL